MATWTKFKTTFEADLAKADDMLKTNWAELVAWMENKHANDAAALAAEIADLQAKGYTVTPPQATTLV